MERNKSADTRKILDEVFNRQAGQTSFFQHWFIEIVEMIVSKIFAFEINAVMWKFFTN